MRHTSNAVSTQLNPFDRPPTKIIALKLCRVYFFPEGCVKTLFYDKHSFEGIAESLANSFSYIIYPLAHNTEVIQPLGMYEEAMILHFQKFLNTAERPIIEGPDWDLLKSQALMLLGDR
jgi:hypothetical protein